MAQGVKNLPAMQERWVQPLGQDGPLENPIQYSYLENFMDRGAWQAIAYGVTTSWTNSVINTFIFTYHHILQMRTSGDKKVK